VYRVPVSLVPEQFVDVVFAGSGSVTCTMFPCTSVAVVFHLPAGSVTAVAFPE
jgi:hypothetical protein